MFRRRPGKSSGAPITRIESMPTFPVELKDPRPADPVLPEGKYKMMVTDVARRFSKGTGRPYWQVTFMPIHGDKYPVYICYSEAPQALWKVREDFGSFDAMVDALGDTYTIKITHEVYMANLRMRGEVFHNKDAQAKLIRQMLRSIPGDTPTEQAIWLARAGLEELNEGDDVTLHLESIIEVLEGDNND